MSELDREESWAPKNWCVWTVVLEKTLEGPLGCKEMQLIHPKGDQSRVFFGRTDVEAETSILWPPDGKSWLIWKDPDAGKDWGQEEKGTTEDEKVGQHHLLDGHEFEETPGVGDRQGGPACCSPWGRKESDTTERLNNKTDHGGSVSSSSFFFLIILLFLKDHFYWSIFKFLFLIIYVFYWSVVSLLCFRCIWNRKSETN